MNISVDKACVFVFILCLVSRFCLEPDQLWARDTRELIYNCSHTYLTIQSATWYVRVSWTCAADVVNRSDYHSCLWRTGCGCPLCVCVCVCVCTVCVCVVCVCVSPACAHTLPPPHLADEASLQPSAFGSIGSLRGLFITQNHSNRELIRPISLLCRGTIGFRAKQLYLQDFKRAYSPQGHYPAQEMRKWAPDVTGKPPKHRALG